MNDTNMQTIAHITKHLRDFYSGNNWTASNLKTQLEGITWQEATTTVYGFNTIAVLVFHINYFVEATLKVLKGNPLDAHDSFSFNCPPINNTKDWEALVTKVFTDAEEFASLIAILPETTLWENIADPKYGDYYRNLHGIIEHNYYHLGQIVLIKKIVKGAEK